MIGCICKESDSEQSFLIHVNINTEVMNANAEREIIAKAVFRSKRDNYLYEYLIQRRKQASFVKEIQVENSSYCASLHKLKKDHELGINVKSALDAFEVKDLFFLGAVAFLYYSSKSIFGCSCDDLWFE